MEDSIFAIIDLGYIYFVMENSGYKSAYTGNLIEYKPESKEQFIENRNYLLSLIPDDQMSEIIKENIAVLKEGELLQNIPNPFNESTQIWYKLENEYVVHLNIYNNTGQLIKSINEGTKIKGIHHIDFDASRLTNGTYFYSISINGQITDSKKMTILK
ncbi:MAG: T9SS type A sorting domain-containing protein [Bacteroidales bacterium]|nr:T9SS type A sorting domain-containing protein [Bacteroidales bacterium]